MIRFHCSECGVALSVSDRFAGRKARCKKCGGSLVIPKPAVPAEGMISKPKTATPPALKIVVAFNEHRPAEGVASRESVSQGTPLAKRKLPMRIRRLMADAENTKRLFSQFQLIRVVSTEGEPPEKYRVEYNVRGLARGNNGQPSFRDQHLVEIQLTSDYPRQSPKCRMLTPIFHPNFDPTIICVGDHWTAAEKLSDLIIRIGEMIAYQAYNIKSPLDGEAAMWADLNQSKFPVDKRSLIPPEL
jgi:ubiquitin-protein ligase/DNA-directed RNA polymerase subunit RPC12/RpoP